MQYAIPNSIDEALALLKEDHSTVIAGCTDFFPAQRPGRQDRNILDVTRIPDLRGMTRTVDGWRIGATTTWSDIARASLPAAFDGLKQAAREVGSIQIQNLGTVVGNICNASPAADGMPPLLALEAEVEIASATGRRRVPLSQFVTGVRQIALAADEMVVAIHIPAQPGTEGSAFLKLGSRKYLVISIVMVAANLRVRDGAIDQARIAVGACSPVAERLPALEADLQGMPVASLAGLTFVPGHFMPLSPIDDVRGTVSYRKGALAELCRRALLRAAGKGH
ncbi:MAG: FAD binding domain-containing protein [Pseudorhodobacter sp.]